MVCNCLPITSSEAWLKTHLGQKAVTNTTSKPGGATQGSDTNARTLQDLSVETVEAEAASYTIMFSGSEDCE